MPFVFIEIVAFRFDRKVLGEVSAVGSVELESSLGESPGEPQPRRVNAVMVRYASKSEEADFVIVGDRSIREFVVEA